MFKEKYLEIQSIEFETQNLKIKRQDLSLKFGQVGIEIQQKIQKINSLKNEITEDLKKIKENVWIETENGPVLITYVRDRMGKEIVFFNTGKSEIEAERLLMLAKLENQK